MSKRTFRFGDSILHIARPEWGAGLVTRAEVVQHHGQSAQRLHVRFPAVGIKVINTAIAEVELQPNGNGAAASAGNSSVSRSATQAVAGPANGRSAVVHVHATGEIDREADRGWIGSLRNGSISEVMVQMPEPAVDPFRTLWQRLRFTLDLYRFTPDARGITEWAMAQTGLTDPLTRMSRQEIDVFYERWSRIRDQHLAQLVRKAQRIDPKKQREMVAAARLGAQEALQRVNHRR